jgi:exosortase A
MNAIGGTAVPEQQAVASAAAPKPQGRAAWIALGLSSLALLLLFQAEVVAAVTTWENNAAYNHGWLVLPIALWLAWGRRQRLSVLPPVPTPAFALLAIPCAIAWLLAERMGIMEGRQLAALGLFYTLSLAVLGLRLNLAMAAPLAYLVFLVPFGEFTVPMLQTITAWMVDVALNLTGIPHYVDSLIIEIPAGTFYVAEACAGLRFIIAALAFGALYAFVVFRSPGRRAIVMFLALVVPIVANGMRAFGLVMLGHFQGSAAAVAADHVLYGWVFFSIVILLLILAGLPFREDAGPPRPATPPAEGTPGFRPARLAMAALLALGLAGIGPAIATTLDARVTEPRMLAVPLRATDGCVALPDGQGLRCGTASVAAQITAFSPNTTWRAVSAERWRLVGSTSDADVTHDIALPGEGGLWRARQTADRATIVAVASWLDGRPVGDGLRSRAAQARNSLLGGGGSPVVASITLQAPEGGVVASTAARDRAMLEVLLAGQAEGLAAQAAALSRRQ